MKLRTLGQKLRPSQRVKVSQPPKKAEPFYLSPEWRALVESEIKRRFGSKDNARCQDPECQHRWRRGIRLFGDHIVERKDGGAELDPANVIFRCGSCHTRKTAAERGKRLRQGEGGSNL